MDVQKVFAFGTFRFFICGKESAMKIETSHVNMASSHNSYSQSYLEETTIERQATADTMGAILKISEEGEKSYKEAIEQFNKDEEKAKKEQQEQNWRNALNQMEEMGKQVREANQAQFQWDMGEDFEITLLKRMLEILNGKKSEYNAKLQQQQEAFKEWQRNIMGNACDDLKENDGVKMTVNGTPTMSLNLTSGRSLGVQVWQRITATSGSYMEYENTAFSTQGTVHTADGRDLSFNLEVELGRSLSQKIDSLSETTFTKILTDPLVINMDSNITSVSDQKFFFDIDSDGKEDEISFAGQGSGFLALDKNEDGIINDGSELFGTKSGDGFKDLAAYDEDKNGWIDENDSVYSKLKVWTKDKDGNDKLLDLKQADVGAIYLGNVGTEFSFKNGAGDTDAVLRKTGIYLKESTGEAGTVAHVDFAL